MPEAKLFSGIAIIIDDAFQGNAPSAIGQIKTQIEDAGCSVVQMVDIPADKTMPSLRNASFFIVDWNLYGHAVKTDLENPPVRIPDSLAEDNAARVIAFLKKLKKVRFAPVFIFTDEVVEEIVSVLKEHSELYVEDLPCHILVKSKAEVVKDGVFAVLNKWLATVPSAYVLKKWEQEYETARNALFVDFYGNSAYWPLVFWKTFGDDGLPPSVELGNLIGRNLLSRMRPFDFDLDSVGKDCAGWEENQDRETLLKVMEGERFVRNERLHDDSIAAGDVFQIDTKDFLINIRPDCDCIVHDGSSESIDLYLLEGGLLTETKVAKLYSPEYRLIDERHNETIIFGMTDQRSISFKFKRLQVRPWDELKDKRIGRLLPPFLTRLQQRYAAYLQRPGLPAIPKDAVPPLPETAEPCKENSTTKIKTPKANTVTKKAKPTKVGEASYAKTKKKVRRKDGKT